MLHKHLSYMCSAWESALLIQLATHSDFVKARIYIPLLIREICMHETATLKLSCSHLVQQHHARRSHEICASCQHACIGRGG